MLGTEHRALWMLSKHSIIERYSQLDFFFGGAQREDGEVRAMRGNFMNCIIQCNLGSCRDWGYKGREEEN